MEKQSAFPSQFLIRPVPIKCIKQIKFLGYFSDFYHHFHHLPSQNICPINCQSLRCYSSMKYLEPGEKYVAKIQKRRTELNQHCTALWSLGPHQALHRNRAVMPVTIYLRCSFVCKTNTAYFCALEKSLFLVIISSSLWTKKEEGRLVALVSHDQGADITVVTYCFLLLLLLSSFTNRNDFTCF